MLREGSLRRILPYLPPAVARELWRLGRSYRRLSEELSELRLRADGRSALLLGGRNVPLSAQVSREELMELVLRLSGGSLYAVRDTLARGYLPFEGGVRVGVVGRARYEDGKLVGVDDIGTVTLRLPTGACELLEELTTLVGAGIGRGLILFSAPGGGKTTALRALAVRLGAHGRRICLIDERDEMPQELFRGTSVDVLRGYRRPTAIEIATRTLNPELLMLDELGDRAEAEALLAALGCGVPVIATAHAATYAQLRARPTVELLLTGGVFEVAAGLMWEGGVRVLRAQRIA